MNSIISQLNNYYSGDELMEELSVLPQYRHNVTTIPERLMALLEVYKVFIPNKTIVDIYNRLYLALINSLDKKNTLLETQLLNDNYRAIKGCKRYGVIGGIESFRITGTAGMGKTSSIHRCAEIITGNKVLISEQPYKEIIPILFVECVADGSFKSLLYSILQEVDTRLGTSYFTANKHQTTTVDVLLAAVSNVLINHETIKGFHDTKARYKVFEKAVAEDVCGRADSVKEEIEFYRSHKHIAEVFGDMLEKGELPLRVTHNDTKLNNIMIDNETHKGICVIDLDTVMPGLAMNDFGDSIRFGASTAAEDEKDLGKVWCDMELFDIYAKGFIEGCGGRLTEKEIELLPMGAMVMTYECGMRFLTDHLQGDTYFKIHRENHNLDRARTQMKLVQDMEAKWETMNEIVKNILRKEKNIAIFCELTHNFL